MARIMTTLHEELCIIVIISCRILLRNRKFSVVVNIKTYILYSINFSENHAVYEVIWKNMVEPDRSQVTV